MMWFLITIVCIIIAYLNILQPLSYWKKQDIPYIKPWPIVGNMLPLILGKESMMDLIIKWYKNTNARYFGVYQFTKPILIIKDIELVKNVCIKDFEYFIDHKTFINETKEPVFSENLFALQGDQWKALRAMLSPAFTGSKMRSMFVLISDCSERFTNHFLKISTPNQPTEIELKEIYKQYTIDIIATCAFGIESNSLEKEDDFYKMGKDVVKTRGLEALKPLLYTLFPSIMRFFKVRFFSDEQLDFFRDIVTKTIKFREEHNIIRPDLIHLLMQARNGQLKFEETPAHSDTGFATVEESYVGKNSTIHLDITDDLIVAQAMIFFIGGTDTNSVLLSLTSYELAINPDIQKRLQKEIDAVFSDNNGRITYDDILKLKYLDMVISETLRRWPQAYFIDRLCVKDYIINPIAPNEKPFVIKKGQSVWIPAAGFHTDPELYPEPQQYNPERFSDKNKHQINPYTYLPFGKGPRSCIGNRFSLLVAKTLLVHLLHKFRIVVTNKTEVPLQISKTDFFLNAANGFWVAYEKRV